MRVKWVGWIALALCACAEPETFDPPRADGVPRLDERWKLEGGLANPESVALSADGRTLYVTNVNGEGQAKDGDGYISRVSVSGAMETRFWARGFNAPKGIALHEGALYVADIDEIVVVDAASGAVRSRHRAPGAVFLNDVAVLRDGTVLAADSGTSRIYAFADGVAGVWKEDPLLESVNGLLVEDARIVVTTMAGRLLAIDPATKAISVLADGLGQADGVARVRGGYLVSEWPGAMYFARDDGTKATVLDSREQNVLLNDFLLVGPVLYQPNWEPSTLTSYQVVQ